MFNELMYSGIFYYQNKLSYTTIIHNIYTNTLIHLYTNHSFILNISTYILEFKLNV